MALPAGEVGRAETRRHGARGSGASEPPIRAGTGGRGPQHEATRGRGKVGSTTLTSTSRPPPAPSGMVFRPLSEIVWARTGRPASSPRPTPHARKRSAPTQLLSSMTSSRGRKHCGERGGRWEALGHRAGSALAGKETGKRLRPLACRRFLCFLLRFIFYLLACLPFLHLLSLQAEVGSA